MTIMNVDSQYDIKRCHKELLEQILLCGDRHCHDALMDRDSYWQISRHVPVFLLSDKSMRKYRKIYPFLEEWEFFEKRDFNPPTELLGFYTRSYGKPFKNTPIVVISPERIAKQVANEEEYLFLTIIVVLHEFAHARMDLNGETRRYGKVDQFYQWMEESLANWQVLEVLEDWPLFDHFMRRNGRS